MMGNEAATFDIITTWRVGMASGSISRMRLRRLFNAP